MSGGEIPVGDPRIMESPVEAGLELAGLTGRRLPQLKLRSARLLSLGVLWSAAVIFMAVITLLSMWDALESGERLISVAGLAYLSLTLLFMPSVGFGLALVILAAKERQFLPFLEKASGAMTALEGRPSAWRGTAGAPVAGGSPLAGILGSAISVGSLVPTVRRMAVVARGVLILLIFGLVFLPVLAALGLLLGTFSATLVALELVVLVVLAYPAASLFRDITDDLRFYAYYSRRQRAIAEAAATGPATVPEGPDPISRFDRYFRSLPPVKALLEAPGAVVEDGAGDPPSTRLYIGNGTGILVRRFDLPPDIKALVALLSEAEALAKKREISMSRAVALVAPGCADIQDADYDHLIGLGERTLPGGCALQLVMEVDGAYSMVPFVAS
jgi:hypothetical protein